MRRTITVLILGCVTSLLAGTAAAQSPRPAVESSVGYAGFIDEAFINHFVVGGAVRAHLSPRLSIGPEVTFMRGPGGDRDWFFTGNATFDLVPPGRRVTPYVLGGGGLMVHRESFVSGPFTSSEGAFTAGGGARVNVGSGWFVAPELRMGWEPHVRYSVTIGRVLK